MGLGLLGQAVGMFAVTNIDDILILALFFGQAARNGRAGVMRVVLGQYLGFVAILAASTVGALGVGLLPESAIPYLGLLPLLLGVRAGWKAWRERHNGEGDGDAGEPSRADGPGIMQVAAVTLANGGDNIGVYVPVFAVAGTGGMVVFVAVFLVGVAVWCMAGRFFATRPVIAKALSRWGHILLPVVLIGIGTLILIEGGAFGWAAGGA
ncbi:cadmium resistance transporter [Actinokineospora sp. HUAS TT18]|uniref:cadmium resistance transporter n=1 Tax=Actinokineospora sp. HUAS TT18 TaxID=3447451 RepID=UPI003F51FEEC